MSETAISICARSLVLLGANPISSFEASEGDGAVICSNVYPGLKRGMMSRHPWRFLMRKKELTKDSDDPVGEWDNSFILPGDAMDGIHAVFRSDQDKKPHTSFEIFERRLLTNEQRAVVDYKVEKSEAFWPVYFVELMVAALCAEIAFVVTDQNNVASEWNLKAYGPAYMEGEGGLMGIAKTSDSMGNQNNELDAYAFIDARFGVSY